MPRRPRHPANILQGIMPGLRPEPSARLRPDMQQVWRDIVGRMPSGWFTSEIYPVLEEYCRNVCYCRDFTAWLDPICVTGLTKDDWPQYNQVYMKYVKATQTMSACAVRLQLTGAAQRRVAGAKALMGTDPTSPGKPWAHEQPSNGRQAEAEEEDVPEGL